MGTSIARENVDMEWLKEKIWSKEAIILKRAIRSVRMFEDEKPIALHLGKWWDPLLVKSFLSAMEEFNVEYEIICFSFYPTMFGADFEPLRQIRDVAKERGKRL